MSISGISGMGAASGLYPNTPSSSGRPPVEAPSPADAFLKHARMSPAERIRAAILEELGITEEELEVTPPAKREALEKTIAEKIRDKLEAASEKKNGMIVDVTV